MVAAEGSKQISREQARPTQAGCYLVMPQSDPAEQILWDSENIPEHVYLELVKCLIDGRLQQRLQLVQPVLDLQPGFGILDVAVLVGVRDGGAIGGVGKAQAFGRGRQQARLEAGDGLVDQVVDGVDHIVYERLLEWLACSLVGVDAD